MTPDTPKRSPNYWAVTTAMALGLLGVSWGLAVVIEAETWPFHLLWGGFFVLMGVLVFVVSRIPRERIRSLPFGNPAAPLPPPPAREALAALDTLAAGLFTSGGVYALTGRLAALSATFAGAMLLGRILSSRKRPAG